MKRLSLALFLGAIATTSNATPVVETWESRVTFAFPGDEIFAVDETFIWSMRYDNSGTRFLDWDDGANNIDENGAGDDFVDSVFCTVHDPNPSECLSIAGNPSLVYSDAILDVSTFFDEIAAHGYVPVDTITDALYSTHVIINGGGEHYIEHYDDLYGLILISGVLNFSLRVTNGHNTIWIDPELDARLISTVPYSSLAEPSIIALLGLGLVGLGLCGKPALRSAT